jgi:hypothetical protein
MINHCFFPTSKHIKKSNPILLKHELSKNIKFSVNINIEFYIYIPAASKKEWFLLMPLKKASQLQTCLGINLRKYVYLENITKHYWEKLKYTYYEKYAKLIN